MKLKWNPPDIRDIKAAYRWGGTEAPYVIGVYFGETLNSGVRNPGRPWVDVVIQNEDIPSIFMKNYDYDFDVDKAFEDTALDLFGLFREAIEDPIWEWPRITHRRSGEVAGSPRNIVDLGNLRDSQRMRITYGA